MQQVREKRGVSCPSPLSWETLLCLLFPEPLQPLGRQRLISGAFGPPPEERAAQASLEEASRPPFAEGLHGAPFSVLCPSRQETGHESALPSSPPTKQGWSSPALPSPAPPLGKLPSSDNGPSSRPSGRSPSHGTSQRRDFVSLWTKSSNRDF